MARVFLTGSLRALAGSTGEAIEIPARDLRELLTRLEERIPDIRRRVDEGLSIAIDGDVISDPLLETLEPDSEVHFLPAIQGGRG